MHYRLNKLYVFSSMINDVQYVNSELSLYIATFEAKLEKKNKWNIIYSFPRFLNSYMVTKSQPIS